MGIKQASGQPPTAVKEAISPSCSTRTRSKTAATTVQVGQNKGSETIDGELSVLTSPAADAPKAAEGKRKRISIAKAKSNTEDQNETPQSTSKKQKTASPKKKDEEKRLRHFRSQAPVNRTRNPDPETPSETISMAGTTGNIYDITITNLPSCTCPDNRKGNQCKHIIYVLHNVLKAPSHLQYQLAFLTSELHLIFDQAPLPIAAASASDTDTSTGATSSNRKEITGDCPICFMEFSPSTEEIIYCKAACGNNIHKDCFEQWARAQTSGAGGVKCVYCRTPWQRDEGDFKHLVKEGKKGGEGYVNIGEELGLSGRRDYSSYHPFWVRRQMAKRGWEEDFDDD
ncbi:MAG: hypothetical protein Q9213_003415 [Squamulea squamosa]